MFWTSIYGWLIIRSGIFLGKYLEQKGVEKKKVKKIDKEKK